MIAGAFEELKSAIPDYSEQFLFHIRLDAGASFEISFANDLEVAAYLPVLPVILNDEHFDTRDFIEFDRRAGIIEMKNKNEDPCDIILFGGERYREAIVAEGPFVMNSMLEIANAYRDFHNGDYGKIDYEKQRSTGYTGK